MARISDEVRSAVLADLRRTLGTPEGAQRLVAQRHGISQSSLRRIAEAEGLQPGITARARIENATAVVTLTNAQRREALAAKLLDVAEEAIEDMRREALVYNFGGKDNTYAEHVLERPGFADRRQLATIAAIALDKHAVLERFDSASAAGQQADLLLRLLTGQGPAPTS